MIEINWSKAPDWAQWWAMEKDNLCYFYQFEPKILGNDDGWTAQKTDWQLDTNWENYNLSGIDWRESLTRRPGHSEKPNTHSGSKRAEFTRELDQDSDAVC
jgi:hypothetical protein